MTETYTKICGVDVKKVCMDALVIGTGAAGYNAAIRLDKYGINDVAIVHTIIGSDCIPVW